MRKALEPVSTVLMEGGLDEDEAFAAASALADLGVKKPAGLADVDEKYARQAADAAGLKPIRADKLVKIIASMSLPSPTAKAEEPSAVAMHLINDFEMNTKATTNNASFCLPSSRLALTVFLFKGGDANGQSLG